MVLKSMKLVFFKNIPLSGDEGVIFSSNTCIYGIDKGSLLIFMEKKQKRKDIIEVEKRKWLEFSEIRIWYEFKYEINEEVISYLKSRLFKNSMSRDIGESWKIKIEDKRMIIKSD